MRGIAAGLTLQQIAADIDVPMGTMRRTFAVELKTARVRLILDNLDRLHAAANRGSVAAMKELARLMQPPAEPKDDDGQWARVVDTAPAFLSQKQEFH